MTIRPTQPVRVRLAALRAMYEIRFAQLEARLNLMDYMLERDGSADAADAADAAREFTAALMAAITADVQALTCADPITSGGVLAAPTLNTQEN